MTSALRPILLATSFFLLVSATPVAKPPLADAIAVDMPSLMNIYKDFHANPELSGMEVRSAAIMAKEARALGFKVTEKVGGHGVVAVMQNGPGPVLMIRADMDGLPVVEQTGLPFASKIKATPATGIETGVMHACGHDTHMAAWIGTARQLVARKSSWSGTLVMIGQPAEETSEGARAMLADGLFTRFPKPTHAIAFHDAAQTPAGMIGYTPGFALANVDSVDISVKGVGGHGAYPQATKDPIVLASRIVGSLQTLVSREVDPQDAAVVTVGSIHGGAKHNIISDEVKLQLTVRSYSDKTRAMLLDGIERIAKGEAIAAGMPEDKMPVVTFSKTDYTPSTFNVPEFTEQMAGVMRGHFGEAKVSKMPASMGGEDFSRFWRADNSLKSMIFWVGGTPASEAAKVGGDYSKTASLHSPYWAPQADAVISTATEALTVLALDILKK